MSIRSKLAGKKTRTGATFTGRKAGLRYRLATKIEGKIRAKLGLPEARCGGLTIKDELKARAKAKAAGCADGSCNGAATVNAVGIPMVLVFAGLCLYALLTAGCASQPSRAQTMTIRDNHINVYLARAVPAPAQPADSNAAPAGAVAGDVFCQAMMIETGGNEANVQDASQEQALNLPLGDTAVSALGEFLGAAISGGAKALVKKDDEPAAAPAATP